MGRYPYFTPSNYTDFLEDVKKHLIRDEPGVIISYPGSGLAWRAEQLVQDYSDGFDAPILLISLSEKTEIEGLLTSLKHVRYVIVLNTEFAFQNGLTDQINNLVKYQRIHHSELNILFLCEKNIFEPTYQKLINQLTFFAHITYFPLYRNNISFEFIKHMSKRWEIKLTPDQTKNIVGYCGGSLWLLKHALRLLMNTPEKKIEELLEDPTMRFRIEAIWDSFTPHEKDDLILICQSSSTKGVSHTNLQYFRMIGIIEKNQITIPLLARYIATKIHKQNIEVVNTEIQINGVPVTGIFSEQERDVFLLLYSHIGTVVDREDIAKALWKDETDEKYSPWAIEQLMRRLRMKLMTLELLRDCIKTARGKGYSLILNN